MVANTARPVPLLLTSSIVAHDLDVQLKDTEARLYHALESVEHWLRLDPKLPVVLCDGSNYDLAPAVNRRFPTASIECLAFDNNQALVKELGRGWGEGEIVKHALRHSQLIQDAGCFAKCTSKLWVENYKDCLRHWSGGLLFSGIFLNIFSPFKPTVFRNLDTRFYVASVAMYERYFVDAHLMMDSRAGHGLEDSFYDIFVQQGLAKCLLPTPPVICGVGGGTGVYYKKRSTRLLKDRLRLLSVRHQSRFCQLFCD